MFAGSGDVISGARSLYNRAAGTPTTDEKGRTLGEAQGTMTRRRLFGLHLYSQIIVPLLAASLLVGIFATTITVFFLKDLTNRWVTQVAQSVTSNLGSSLDRYASGMQHVVWLTADDLAVQRAAVSQNLPALKSVLQGANVGLAYDDLMVLDASGAVLAATGTTGMRPGDLPLGTQGAAGPGEGRSLRTIVVPLGSKVAMVSVQPFVGSDGMYYSVAVARVISNEFIRSLAGTPSSALCFYNVHGQLVACSLLDQTPPIGRQDLATALKGDSSPVREAIAGASSDTGGVSHLTVDGTRYMVFARPVSRPSVSGEATGPLLGYAVGTVSQTASDQAASTTINLIIIWSIVAVVALSGLGGWLARSVAEPLAELADGARRVADGDFSTKVRVEGSQEIEQLGEAFNEMTDSLRERSESLTKKVLELATLYEMSRALGSTLDMDELLGSVLDSALRIFDLDLGYVALRDRESSVLSIRAVRGGMSDAVNAVRSSMSEWVVREGRPLIFNPDPTGEGQVDVVTGARAALCVPLSSSEGTIGSITVGSEDLEYRFNAEDVRLLSTIANHVAIAIGNIELFSSLQDAYLATVRSLAAAVDAKDSFTRGHSDRVATYATRIAQRLGVAHEQRVALEMAAYLHDIGKIGVPEEILLKPGRLTEPEMAEMRHHPLIGANILKQVAFPWAITPVVRHHHEHFDGSGYPAGLKGEEIPLLARILTAADSFEAMTADRPYRRGFSEAEAIEELRRCAGTQFDPRVVETLVEIVKEEGIEAANVHAQPLEEISAEETRAIFGALVDGVLASFRHLGGPRLASNVEAEVDERFESEGWPFRITRGRVRFADLSGPSERSELEQMRDAMRMLDATLSRVSGSTLVDHFYADAYAGFSERMQQLAAELGLRT